MASPRYLAVQVSTCHVISDIARRWHVSSSATSSSTLELVPCVITLLVWSSTSPPRGIIWFVDSLLRHRPVTVRSLTPRHRHRDPLPRVARALSRYGNSRATSHSEIAFAVDLCHLSSSGRIWNGGGTRVACWLRRFWDFSGKSLAGFLNFSGRIWIFRQPQFSGDPFKFSVKIYHSFPPGRPRTGVHHTTWLSQKPFVF